MRPRTFRLVTDRGHREGGFKLAFTAFCRARELLATGHKRVVVWDERAKKGDEPKWVLENM